VTGTGAGVTGGLAAAGDSITGSGTGIAADRGASVFVTGRVLAALRAGAGFFLGVDSSTFGGVALLIVASGAGVDAGATAAGDSAGAATGDGVIGEGVAAGVGSVAATGDDTGA